MPILFSSFGILKEVENPWTKLLFLCNYTHKLSSFKLYFSALTEFSYFEAKALIGQLHDDVIY